MNPPSKNTLTTLLLLCVAVLAYRASTPVTVDPIILVEYSKSAVALSHIRQEAAITERAQQWIDVIDFPNDQRLSHAALGGAPFDYNFFAELHAEFEVREEGSYLFRVESDDGFFLEIDGKEVCAFEKDRPMQPTLCSTRLSLGRHTFRLRYFQGHGQAGLVVRYKEASEQGYSLVGEDSRRFRFIPKG